MANNLLRSERRTSISSGSMRITLVSGRKALVPSAAVVGTMTDFSEVQCAKALRPTSVVAEGMETYTSKVHCSKAQLPISGADANASGQRGAA